MAIKKYTLTLLLIALFSTVTTAQQLCNALVTQALTAIADNCNALDRNSVCYGYNLVQASFAQEVPANFFVQPADRAPIDGLAKLQTAGLDTANNHWGVAVMSLQANVPNTLPGQAVTFILMGETELENSVLPEDSFSPADPITVTLASDTSLRSTPSKTGNAIATAVSGETLDADGISKDGNWVRVVFGEVFGWIEVTHLADASLIAGLPTLDGTQRMPMQAFYLRNGIGEPECAQASDALMVQGPKNTRIDLTVNGAIVNFGSTILFRVLPPGDRMEVVVIDGDVIVKQDENDPNPKQVFAGQRSEVCLAPPDNLGVDGTANDQLATCEWSAPEDIPQEDLAGSWCQLTGIDSLVLNYGIELTCPEEVVLEQEETPSPPQPFGQNQPPAETQEPSTGIQNWCDVGGKWEGQCDNPDPAIREWYYNAGWYFAQVDNGNLTLSQVPSQYYTPPPAGNGGTVTSFSFSINFVCTIDMGIVWSGLPAGSSLEVTNLAVDMTPIESFVLLDPSDTSPSGTSYINYCYAGDYTVDYSVTGSFSTSGSLSGYCFAMC